MHEENNKFNTDKVLLNQIDNFLKDCLQQKEFLSSKRNLIRKIENSKYLKAKQKNQEVELNSDNKHQYMNNMIKSCDQLIEESNSLDLDNQISFETDVYESFDIVDLKNDTICNLLSKIKTELIDYNRNYIESTQENASSKFDIVKETAKLDNDLKSLKKVFKPFQDKYLSLKKKFEGS